MSLKLHATGPSRAQPELDPERLQHRLSMLLDALRGFPPDLPEEAVHAIRAGVRSVETMILALGIGEVEEGFPDSLAKLRKRTGKVRDFDVMTSYAAALALDGVQLQDRDCHSRLMKYLHEERSWCARKLHHSIGRHKSRVRSGTKRLSRKVKKISGGGRSSHNSRIFTQWNRSAAESVTRLEEELAQPEELGGQHLHIFRMKVRELRFLLRLRRQFDHRITRKLGVLKDVIGVWHDWALLEAAAKEISAHPADCQLLRLIASTAQRKRDEAILAISAMSLLKNAPKQQARREMK